MRVNLSDGVSCVFEDADRVGVEDGFVVLRGVPTETNPAGIVVASYPRNEVESVDLDIETVKA